METARLAGNSLAVSDVDWNRPGAGKSLVAAGKGLFAAGRELLVAHRETLAADREPLAAGQGRQYQSQYQ
jgi:hypothetical protein